LLKYSKKLPIAKLFKYSAMVISFLAVVLTGKGISALQEAGTLNITVLPFDFRLDALGLYPTYETLFGQLFILSLTIVLWNISNRKKPNLVVKPA
jgi:high-affinity iron transporter